MMKNEFENMELVNDLVRHVFEIKFGDESAYIKYSNKDNKMYLMHTEVPDNHEGKGVGSALVEKTFNYLEENQLKAVPLCPFIVTYLKRHPEWNRIVDK